MHAHTHTHTHTRHIYTHNHPHVCQEQFSILFHPTLKNENSPFLITPHPSPPQMNKRIRQNIHAHMCTKQELQVHATAAYPVIQAGTSRSQHLEDRQVAVLRRTHQGRLQCLVLRVQACSSLNNRLKKCSICSSTSRKLHVSINMYILYQKKIQQLV